MDDLKEQNGPIAYGTAASYTEEKAGPPTYCIITPVRNEQQFISGTIESVFKQTVLPAEWIIVDDGSTDATASTIDQYAQQHSWIRALHRKDRGFRLTGGGVDAFLHAYPSLHSRDWQYLVNLDADLTFPPDYFEKCFEHFRRSPRLGIGGGTIFDKVGEQLHLDKAPAFHVRGGTKIYRKECWDQLGGLLPSLGWDTVDELKANQLGWETHTFPDLQLIHHRASGAAWGDWGHALNEGEADYIVGYHPLFFFLKCLRHVFVSPYLIRSIGIAAGFLRLAVRRAPRMNDRELRSYLRKQQLRRIFGATTIWK